MTDVMLFANPSRDIGLAATKEIAELLHSKNVRVYANDKELLPHLPHFVRYAGVDDMSRMDAVVTLGGDGTILKASRLCAVHSTPIIAVNVGKIGFLAELELDEFSLFDQILSGDYSLDKRMMLDVSVVRNGETVFSSFALNDAVLSTGPISRIIQLDVSVEPTGSMCIRGDGVIFATPTGSTAYSMAAGGPIVEPWVNNTIMTPICPHGLYDRSFILNGDRKITVRPFSQSGEIFLTVDGDDSVHVENQDIINIKKSDRVTCFLRTKDNSFYDILTRKLSSMMF